MSGMVIGTVSGIVSGMVSDMMSSMISGMVNDMVSGMVSGMLSAYIAPIFHLINSFAISHHSYADDITLYTSLGDNSRTVHLNCVSSVGHWFLLNDLLLKRS